jgi:hypothetical protein
MRVATHRRAVLTLIAISFFGTLVANADPMGPLTIKSLFELCKATDPLKRDYCQIYLLGVSQVMQLNGYASADNESEAGRARDFLAHMGICYPPGFTTEHLGQIFQNWAAANPKDWSDPAVSGAVLAFHEAWPCPKNGQ